ncbi:MAG: response regulator [Candidatus Thiodiazotropha sp.]
MNAQDKPIILIADDSRVVRVSLKNILKNDCQLIEAEDGQQAWEQLLESPDIRLIFSDLSMPKLDGRGLLQKIRNSEITRIRNIPFIVVTGNEAESGTRDELQELGATEVVSKPFDPARIVSFVTTLVSQQENQSYMLLHEEGDQTEYLQGVLNQKDFMLGASKELSFAIRNKNELAIALLRIDQFDQLEAHYSEPAIEHILLTTVEIIRQHIHPDDTMAYFGDGLFAILRPASNAIGTRYIGRRIVENMSAKQFYLGESDEVVSVSMGISAPQIKPGIRLSELILLAEGRLKAAMDLGGHRVIDKGNETLTPVAPPSDSAPSVMTDPEAASNLHHDSIKSSHLRLDDISTHSALASTQDTQELEDKIDRLQSTLQSLGQENKDLQTQVDRLRNQSSESEQLRRRVFELESEQQQMQLKLNELSSDKVELQKRAEQAESAQHELLENEQERQITLEQANQFYEQENLRLEGQLEALNNRAQKAELAQRKSEQLVISLKDNIKLLRAQMEQIQNELLVAQQQSVQPAATSEAAHDTRQTAVDTDTDPLLDEETHIEQRADSDLAFNGFPSSMPASMQSSQSPLADLFAESKTPVKQETTESSRPRQAQKVEPEQPALSIPVYRPQQREKAPREYRPLSSFAIASLIMFLLLGVGGGYLYHYWTSDPVPTDSTVTESKPVDTTDDSNAENVTRDPTVIPDTSAKSATKTEVTSDQATDAYEVSTSTLATAAPGHAQTSDAEAILQAELTLRQIAEEEFQHRLQNAGKDAVQTPPPGVGGNGDLTDVEGAVQADGSSADEATQVSPTPAQQTSDAGIAADGDNAMQTPPEAPGQTLLQ